MLKACRDLGLQFRAHVKTHKTVEVTGLQVGTSSAQICLVVSTLAEFEYLLVNRNVWAGSPTQKFNV